MKRAIIFLIIGALLGGGIVYFKTRPAGAPDADEKTAATAAAPADSAGETHISHDTNGNVVIAVSEDTLKDMGLQTTNTAAAQFSPELKGYGHVQDTAALAGMVNDLASAQAAYLASSNEFERLKILGSQGNASARALQAAQAAAAHDQLAIQAAHDHLLLSSTPALTDRPDLPAFIQSLAAQNAALVRVDLPAGEVPPAAPTGARIVSLAGDSVDAGFLGAASATDPQIQGHGFFFLVSSNSAGLAPGEAVTGYLKLPGDPLTGVIVPRDSIVRAGGANWIYVRNADGKSYTRRMIALDHAVEGGWFVTNGVSPGDPLVLTGAQSLLSEELKASIQAD